MVSNQQRVLHHIHVHAFVATNYDIIRSMKHCKSCDTIKKVTEFAINRSTKDGLQSQCKECRHLYYKTKVYPRLKEKDRLKKSNRAGYIKLRSEYREHKSKPCTDCGIMYPPYVMEFDHLGDKLYNISDIVRNGCKKKYLAEIAKCELVCSNCHRIRTHNRRHAAVA